MILSAAAALQAGNIPQSVCNFNVPGNNVSGVSCTLYPSDINGNLSTNVLVQLPATLDKSGSNAGDITGGYLVVDSFAPQPDPCLTTPFPACFTDSNTAHWRAVLQFNVANGDFGASSLNYITGNFSSVSAAVLDVNANTFFVPAVGNLVNACPTCSVQNTFSLTPEPGTLVFSGLGFAIAGLVAARRRAVVSKSAVSKKEGSDETI